MSALPSGKVERSGTAILVFSRTAAEEARVKVFHTQVGRQANKKIADRLIKHSIDTARKTGLPVYTKFSSEQTGSNFGERLANAFEDLFKLGFERVISIGNDSPDLSTASLVVAAQELQVKNLILGPALDGGVYLIGLSREGYQRQAFIDLPWETAQLQAAWNKYSVDFAEDLTWLEFNSDIDHSVDFTHFLFGLAERNQLGRELLNILNYCQCRLPLRPQIYHSTIAIPNAPLRAPPF